ncbi:Wzz/FepE/Etk N-terminal domain-containing protein [Vogesella sp. SH7W]|uniref:Wzz/FepE/Etk N-terminal domain-containing protein n=1 Tax=Vogesella indigofera TaxID=45465 RepID=A0ABT5I0F1_VOGIN|nr:Wzz/FepE/Etk N-terminal domain-containing protein [Vogesella indigofera]
MSLLDLATALVVQRRTILGCLFAGLLLASGYAWLKPPSYSATATLIMRDNANAGVSGLALQSLAQSTLIKQPLAASLQQAGLLNAEALEGVYSVSFSAKDGQLQLTVRLPQAAQAQRYANQVQQEVLLQTKARGLSATSNDIIKLRQVQTQNLARPSTSGFVALPAGDRQLIDSFAQINAKLALNGIMRSSNTQDTQQMQDELALFARSVARQHTGSSQFATYFQHSYQQALASLLDNQIQLLEQQQQREILALEAPLPQKQDKPGHSLILMLGALGGLFCGVLLALTRHALLTSRANPANRERWEALHRAWRS